MPSLLLAVTCLVAAPTSSRAQLADAARNVRQIIAHRGSSSDRPENTLAAFARAIEVGATAVEVDIRTTQDKQLVLSHDATLDRTTNGQGNIADKTLAELKTLDAGSKFGPQFRNERVPTLAEALMLCRGKIDVLLDLKEQGETYALAVATEIRSHGEPRRTIVGVRSTQQAAQFRKLLPEARQLGLIPDQQAIEPFAAAGVEMIRLWPKWLDDASLVPRVRKAGVKLHLNNTTGSVEEVTPLLAHRPESMSSDDPQRLLKTLADLR